MGGFKLRDEEGKNLGKRPAFHVGNDKKEEEIAPYTNSPFGVSTSLGSLKDGKAYIVR